MHVSKHVYGLSGRQDSIWTECLMECSFTVQPKVQSVRWNVVLQTPFFNIQHKNTTIKYYV